MTDTYAWDIAEHGVPAISAELGARGINTITLASSYHAGKFIRPRGRAGKVYFPEDGVVYFRHDAKAYGEIRPQPSVLGTKAATSGRWRKPPVSWRPAFTNRGRRAFAATFGMSSAA